MLRFLFSVLALQFFASGVAAAEEKPKNLIFMIPDGMGPAAVTLARDYWGQLVIDDILVGSASVASTNFQVPDSAATATAMATGVNTANRMIAIDDQGKHLLTIMESAERSGMATGMVVTSPLQNATPAAFSAHVDDRDKYRQIAAQQLEQGIDLMLGGGAKYLVAGPVTAADREVNDLATASPVSDQAGELWYPDLFARARSVGYEVITIAQELEHAGLPVLGVFARDWMTSALDVANGKGPEEPTLVSMTRFALEKLAADENGFVLLIEGSMIDSAEHYYDPGWLVYDIRSFDQSVAVALAFARRRQDTLLVAMSDHETGGLSLGRMLRKEQVGEKNYSRNWNTQLLKQQKASVLAMITRIRNGDDPVEVFIEGTGIGKLFPDQVQELMSIPDMDLADEEIEEDAMRIIGAVLSSYVKVDWSTSFHTAVDVGVYAFGPGSKRLSGHHRNWEIGRLIAEIMGLSVAGTPSEDGRADNTRTDKK